MSLTQRFLSELAARTPDDRRGFCAGVFHRQVRLRGGRLLIPGSNGIMEEAAGQVWAYFLDGDDPEAILEIHDQVEAQFPGEDDDLCFEMDTTTLLVLLDVIMAMAEPDCPVAADIIGNALETVRDMVQVELAPGVVTKAINEAVDRHPQVLQEVAFLESLLDGCVGLQEPARRAELRDRVTAACAGDLWAPLDAQRELR
jgi:hypothetical protein